MVLRETQMSECSVVKWATECKQGGRKRCFQQWWQYCWQKLWTKW